MCLILFTLRGMLVIHDHNESNTTNLSWTSSCFFRFSFKPLLQRGIFISLNLSELPLEDLKFLPCREMVTLSALGTARARSFPQLHENRLIPCSFAVVMGFAEAVCSNDYPDT